MAMSYVYGTPYEGKGLKKEEVAKEEAIKAEAAKEAVEKKEE